MWKKLQNVKMTEKQKEHFEAFAIIADHLEAYADKEEAEKNLDYAEAARQAQRMEDDKMKLFNMYSFFIGPKNHPEFTNGQAIKYAQLAGMTNGETGIMITPVPLVAKFKRDLFNEGVVNQWYLPEYDDSGWETRTHFIPGKLRTILKMPGDMIMMAMDGIGFSVRIPQDAVNKPLKLHLGGVINEGWVWINGEYVGHRPWKLWWAGRDELEMDVDVTGKVKPGENVVAVRVWNNAEIGGLFPQGFSLGTQKIKQLQERPTTE